MLEVRNIRLSYGATPILKSANFHLERGRILGLVGSSGSGKTLLSLAILGLLPHGVSCAGEVVWQGHVISAPHNTRLMGLRGRDIGIVFQNTSAAFDPLITIGDQLAYLFRYHNNLSRQAARDAAHSVFKSVEWPANIDPFDRYPHEISGGQRQRALIAMAIALKPALVIADEPTASLDVTTAKAMLDLLQRLAREQGSSLLIISHDLPALATCVDEIAHLHDGVINGTTPISAIANKTAPAPLLDMFQRSLAPRHILKLRGTPERDVIATSHLCVSHHKQRFSLFGKADMVKAVRDVTLRVARGTCLAIVGESGSGKSTLARALLGLDQPQSGSISIAGIDPSEPKTRRALWQNLQLMFQDPFGAVDPNWTVQKIVDEALALSDAPLDREERRKRVADALIQVGLEQNLSDRFPHQLSGGQLQRVTLARALVARPEILVLDEPISALDADARGQILGLLAQIAGETGLTLLIITHDLGVARSIADHVIVMKDGEIIEQGEIMAVLEDPQHAYTKALIAASPMLNATRLSSADLAGDAAQG